MLHEIRVNGYAAEADGPLDLGTWGSYGTEQLHYTFDAAWDDLTKSDTLSTDGYTGEAVTLLLPESGRVEVTQQATAAQTVCGRITVLGTCAGVQRISADLPYPPPCPGRPRTACPAPLKRSARRPNGPAAEHRTPRTPPHWPRPRHKLPRPRHRTPSAWPPAEAISPWTKASPTAPPPAAAGRPTTICRPITPWGRRSVLAGMFSCWNCWAANKPEKEECA